MKSEWKSLIKLKEQIKTRLKPLTGVKIDADHDLYPDLLIYTKVKSLESRLKRGEHITEEVKVYHEEIKHLIPTSTRRKHKVAEEETKSTKNLEEDLNESDHNDENIIIGPTPQLNGRIRDLFSMVQTPDKSERSINETPKKPNLATDDKSPVSTKIIDSPVFMKYSQNDTEDIGIEPSPIFNRGKSLSKLHKEVESIKRNLLDKIQNAESNTESTDEKEADGKLEIPVLSQPLTHPDNEQHSSMNSNGNIFNTSKSDFDHIMSSSSESEAAEEEEEKEGLNDRQNDNMAWQSYKVKTKTIKRTNRRVKIKPQVYEEEVDKFDTINVHEYIQKEKNRPGQKSMEADSSESDYDSSKEEEYTPMDFTELIEKQKHRKLKKGEHPLGNNFVKMKIHKRKGHGRFQRRR